MSNYRNERLQKMADIFSALSNPNRLQIFLRLLACCSPGSVCDTTEEEVGSWAGDIGRGLGIAPSTVCHHLKELRRAGLVRTERNGQRVLCSVDIEVLQELIDFFGRDSVRSET